MEKGLKQIEFKVPKNYLEQKLKKLDKHRYRTKHEKEVLIHDESDDPFVYLDILTQLPKELYPKSEVECLVYLMYLRAISVSDYLDIMHKCESCGTLNEIQIDLFQLIKTDLKVDNKYNYDFSNFPIGVFKNIDEILDEKISDELPILVFNYIEQIIDENNLKIINLIHEYNCRKCKKQNMIYINPMKILSRVELTGLYKEIFSLTYFTNNSITEIEELYPFERNIYLNLTDESIKSGNINPVKLMS